MGQHLVEQRDRPHCVPEAVRVQAFLERDSGWTAAPTVRRQYQLLANRCAGRRRLQQGQDTDQLLHAQLETPGISIYDDRFQE